MRGFIAAQSTGQIAFYFSLRVAAILLAELHADARGAFALCTLGCHPDDTACDWQLFILAHQVQQHEYFVAEAIVAVGRNKQATVFHEWHVSKIQGALVLDGQCEQSGLAGWLPHHHLRLLPCSAVACSAPCHRRAWSQGV